MNTYFVLLTLSNPINIIQIISNDKIILIFTNSENVMTFQHF